MVKNQNKTQFWALFFFVFLSSLALSPSASLGLSWTNSWHPAFTVNATVVVFCLSALVFAAAKANLICALLRKDKVYSCIATALLVSPLTYRFTFAAYWFLAFAFVFVYGCLSLFKKQVADIFLPICMLFFAIGYCSHTLLFILLTVCITVLRGDHSDPNRFSISVVCALLSFAVGLVARFTFLQTPLYNLMVFLGNQNVINSAKRVYGIFPALLCLAVGFILYFVFNQSVQKLPTAHKHYESRLLVVSIFAAVALLFGLATRNYMLFAVVPYAFVLFLLFPKADSSQSAHPVLLELCDTISRKKPLFYCALLAYTILMFTCMQSCFHRDGTLLAECATYF